MKTYDVEHSPFWITKAKALEMGMTMHGTHCRVAVYARDIDGAMDVIAKAPWLDWCITFGGWWLQTLNFFREPGDEIPFSFLLQPIEDEHTTEV